MQTEPPALPSVGVPVEVAQIDRELKKLWQDGGEVMTRASLINLAVYSEAPDSLARNTQIVSEITKDHACRAIVISAHCSAAADGVEAWINAHCHVGAGSKQVCSEQLSFLLNGSFTKLLPNIVFSHLDSDLPFYLWWQGNLPDPIDPQLWSWVDRLIFDSRDWQDFGQQLRLLERVHGEANQRVVLCDLNWTRLVLLRLAIAQFFDHPGSHKQLANISRMEIDFAPECRSTAILMVGWLAAQLDWTSSSGGSATELTFATSQQKHIAVVLMETPGEPIGRCSLFAERTEFRVAHTPSAELLETSVRVDGKDRMHQLMPAARNDLVHLMSEELMRGGPHQVYRRAVERVRALL